MPLPPLAPDQLVKPARFELRLSIIFAAIFVPLGVHLAYFPLWLEAKGFDAAQIAVVLSAPMFLRVATTPLITALADRAGDRATVLIALIAVTFCVSLGYFLPPAYATVLAVSLALQMLWSAQAPLADSLALSGVRRFGSNYPAMRIWGSITFLLANFLGGMILAATSADVVPLMISAGLATAFAASLFAPRLGRPRRASPLSATEIQDKGGKLLTPYFLCFVVGLGVITASHGFLYAFVSIYWKSIGIGDTTIGLLWAWAVVAEVGMFLAFDRIFGRTSATTVLLISGVAAFVRWTVYPFIEVLGLGVGGFFAVQTLHAASTAMGIIGLQKLIAETVHEERTGAAQGIAFFATGIAMALVTLVSGPLYQQFGTGGFFFMAGLALVGIAFIAGAARSSPERRFRG